jgi:hypothetical protein
VTVPAADANTTAPEPSAESHSATPGPAGLSAKAAELVLPIHRWWRRQRHSAARWWAWTERPLSLRAAWRLSTVDASRVPATGRWWLLLLWRASNGTDRLAWFALMLVAPSALQGPLRWAAARPARRIGTYILLALLAVVVFVLLPLKVS